VFGLLSSMVDTTLLLSWFGMMVLWMRDEMMAWIGWFQVCLSSVTGNDQSRVQ
jgi:hypothetical protein